MSHVAIERSPVVLIIRDGWGRNPNADHDAFNAIKLARTPVCDDLLAEYPWTLIRTSGLDVGLPPGTMGNSEVGHQNLGAGRIVDQDSVRISRAIEEGPFFDNAILRAALAAARDAGRAVHFMGLASDAGVHARLDHLYALLELARRCKVRAPWIHLFTDGRDTGPSTGLGYVRDVEAKCREFGAGKIASLMGRYWAMDRDNRWERVERAYDCLCGRGDGFPNFDSPAAAIQDYYENPESSTLKGDEFVTPRTIGRPGESRIRPGDTVIFFNYRGDRPRQLSRAFVQREFFGHVDPSPESGARGFERPEWLDLRYVTMTSYEQALSELVDVAFPKPPPLPCIAGEYLAERGLTQFRCAESEKLPHVTFFFNDYREEAFPGERRGPVQSPRVATYDLQPEMSAPEVARRVLERIRAEDCERFILVNFANTDMVGHTGDLQAAISAAETVDGLVGQITEATLERGGALVVTADHGNAEQMWDPATGGPHTAHTTYDVECIIVAADRRPDATGSPDRVSPALRSDGRLADVFPTVLDLMGLEKPREMTGSSLLR
jgi:2,3-bisphosphoglycerate-independent phosphoglycerate mutase